MDSGAASPVWLGWGGGGARRGGAAGGAGGAGGGGGGGVGGGAGVAGVAWGAHRPPRLAERTGVHGRFLLVPLGPSAHGETAHRSGVVWCTMCCGARCAAAHDVLW